MDWQRIWMLLEVVHKSLNVPGTEFLRNAALAELAKYSAPKAVPATVVEPQLPLESQERRL